MTATILVAIVNRNLREAMADFFTSMGYTVETAYDGADWVARLGQMTAETVVVDAHLLLDGASHLQALLRADPGITRIPMVLLNAEAVPPAKLAMLHWPMMIQLDSPVLLAAVEAAVVFARLAMSDCDRAPRHAPLPDWGRATYASGELA